MKVLIGNSKTPVEFKKDPKDGWWENKKAGLAISPNLKVCETYPWYVDSCEPTKHKFKIVK